MDNKKEDNSGSPILNSLFILLFGALLCYLLLDVYVQKKVDLSLIQIVKLVNKKNNSDKIKQKKRDTFIYKLDINGYEHNFTFTNFHLGNLKIDGITIENIKRIDK